MGESLQSQGDVVHLPAIENNRVEFNSTPFDPVQYQSSYLNHGISDLNVTAPQSKPDAAGVQSCKASPDYETYLDVTARHIYAPSDLGDLTDLKHKYDCDIRTTDDVFSFANKALAVTGDKYTHALTPGELTNFRRLQNSGFTGIGIELDKSPLAGAGETSPESVITSVRPGLPAEKAGLQAGDAFVSINGRDAQKLTPSDITNIITSAGPGTKFDIFVNRNGAPVEKIVTSQQIDNLPVVHDKDLGDGVVYIKIDSFFDGHEADQLKGVLEKNKDAKAFVIDVRGNGGGFVQQSLDSLEMFIKSGRLMSTTQRLDSPPDKPVYRNDSYDLDANNLVTNHQQSDTGQVSSDKANRYPYLLADRPLALLVNGDTASASEIFTGAIHDTGHDTVFGTTTFGKGIAQDMFTNVPDGGALKVTTEKYFVPSGQWPGDAANHRFGLNPDIVIQNPANTVFGSPEDAQLNGAVTYLKTKLLGD